MCEVCVCGTVTTLLSVFMMETNAIMVFLGNIL